METHPMNAILTNDELRTMAPSIFASSPWANVSTNYRFVPTSEVLGLMQDQGFFPVMAKQSRTRIEGKQPFTKHLIRLRHRDHLGTTLSDEIPELVLINSHDRSSAYKLFAGVFRLICENGMIIASEDYGSFALRHSGVRDLRQQIIDTTGEVLSITAQAFENVNQWKGISLTRPQQLALASAASELKPNASIEPVKLLEARRPADEADQGGNRDLWRTTNVLQESLIRGGIKGQTTRGRKVTTKAVKSVTGDLAVNRGLWRLAEEMAKLV
jgi:Domain of unknown function (DUF932)